LLFWNLVPQYRQIQQIAHRLRIIGDELDADERIKRYKLTVIKTISILIFRMRDLKVERLLVFDPYFHISFTAILCFFL